MEGLAESFAAELYGHEFVGPFITEVTPDDVATARQVIGQALEVRGFNEVRAYIFGDEVMAAFGGGKPVGVPAYAGYTTGFHVVQAYSARQERRRPRPRWSPRRRFSGWLITFRLLIN